ncbi:MAG: uracil-DNA glycosylase [Rhodocyclaceae bacterium]
MTRRESILREMGLAPLWRLRGRPVAIAETPAETAPVPSVVPADDRARRIADMGWDALRTAVAECRDCRLCEKRKQAVLGVGDVEADWFFVGEGPGAEEDERGEPFVGQAGKLLDAMLAAIDLARGRKVYIGNVVKCRPPGNRTPEPEETAACFPYLQRQIALVRPKLLVALGKPAAETLLNAEVKVGASRGRLFDYRGIPLIVTYHPAYLLRNLTDKARAWEDLCFARRTMQGLDDVGA